MDSGDGDGDGDGDVCIYRYLPVRVSGDRRQNVDVESISFG